MRSVLFFLLLPLIVPAQINPVYIVKKNLQYTQLEASGDGMFGFEKDGKYGYMDKNEKIVIPAIYEFTGAYLHTIPKFIRGHVVVRKDIKYAILDKTGKITTPLEFGYLAIFPLLPNHILISRRPDGRQLYGICTFDNKLIIPMEYQEFIADSNMIIAKQNDKYGLFDLDGKLLIPVEYSSLTAYPKEGILRAEKDGKYGMVDNKGNWLFTKEKSVYTLLGASQGMIRCMVSNKYGFLDRRGNEVIITKYDNAYDFDNIGLAKVAKKIAGSSNSHYGYVDRKGNEVIPLKYESMGVFVNGSVIAKDPETNRYGYLDKTGKWIIQPAYLDGMGFDSFGGAWVKMTDAKWHYINKTGKDFGAFNETTYKNFNPDDGYAIWEVNDYPCVFIDRTGMVLQTLTDGDAIYSFSDGIAGYRCKSNLKYGFIDASGKLFGACTYDGFGGFNEGISRVDIKVSGKTKSGYINSKGETILPIEYEDVRNFRNGWGLIKKDSTYFFVDKNGKMKELPRKYDNIYEFKSGFAVGMNKGENNGPNTYYYINTELKEQFNIKAKEAYLFWDDVAVIKRDKDYELVNKKGEIFQTLTGIENLKFSTDGMLAVRNNGKWGYMDNKGNMVIAAKYDSCEQFKYGYGRFKLNGKWGILDKNGNEIIEAKYENILSGDNGVFTYYDKSWGIIDKTGKMVIVPTFYNISPFEKDRALARLGKSYTILKSPLAK